MAQVDLIPASGTHCARFSQETWCGMVVLVVVVVLGGWVVVDGLGFGGGGWLLV